MAFTLSLSKLIHFVVIVNKESYVRPYYISGHVKNIASRGPHCPSFSYDISTEGNCNVIRYFLRFPPNSSSMTVTYQLLRIGRTSLSLDTKQGKLF